MKLFDMLTNEDLKRIKVQQIELENEKLKDKVKEAGKINQLHQELNEKLKKRAQEAEGENTIIKGIGSNSPEMKAAHERIKELEGKCREAGRAMIELNMKYEANIKELDRLAEENTNLKLMLKGTDGF